MKIIKPSYYDKFECIAGECSFTCCRDWKIAVDRKTRLQWEKMTIPYSNRKLSTCTCAELGDFKIKLTDEGLCPLLTKEGLCSVVKEYGEEFISDTCHTFPREKHSFEDRNELTLTMGCPQALRLLWEETEFNMVCTDEKLDTDKNIPCAEFDCLIGKIRDGFIKLVSNEEYDLSKAIMMIFYMALDFYEREEDLEEEYIEEVFNHSFLTNLYDAVRNADISLEEKYEEQNELFLDIAANYREKKIYTDFIERLAVLAEKYEKDGIPFELRNEFEQFFSNECEKKMRLLLAEELYSTMYLENGNLYTVLIKLEWTGITYAVLKHCLFLKWVTNNKHIYFDDIIEAVVVIIRMTGYTEDDIEEYLEECFEDAIWDWGYMALIV